MVKFEDAFWGVLVGCFLVDFWLIFHVFLVLPTRKNRVIYIQCFYAFGIQKKVLHDNMQEIA